MILDKTLEFSDAQAITATAASTNVIDLGATGTPFGGVALTRNLGIGPEIPVSVRVVTSFATLTSLTVAVQTSPDNSTWTTIESGRVVPVAELIAGHQFSVPCCLEEGVKVRYVRLNYTVTGSNATAGAVSAGIVASRQTNLTYGGA